jgi:hypothetical protein
VTGSAIVTAIRPVPSSIALRRVAGPIGRARIGLMSQIAGTKRTETIKLAKDRQDQEAWFAPARPPS